MVTYTDIEHELQTYSFEDILEQNELTEADVLYLMVKHDLIELPNPKPVDLIL